jgi:hypothetical protein
VGHVSIEFGQAKEPRDWYFVEYLPPQAGVWFATLSLVMLRDADASSIADAMESEARLWMNRYPVPVMVSAFDVVGDLIDLDTRRPCSHLVGLPGDDLGPQLLWKLVPDGEAPNGPFTDAALRRIYSDYPGGMTDSEVRDAEFAEHARVIRRGRALITIWLLVWLAAIPLAWAVVQWGGPHWLATLVMLYAAYKAVVQALKLLGVLRPSAKEQQTQDRERRMEHYFYHCEQNPEGFERLKAENFDREARAQTIAEAEALQRERQDGVQQALRADNTPREK